MRTDGSMLTFTPHLPAGWQRMRFAVSYRGRDYRVELTPTQTQIKEMEKA
ncbi:glycosyl hydrolase family 65 protein [Lacticaseibacillus absianus]